MRAWVWWGAGTHVWMQRPENVWRSALPLSLISLRLGLPLNLELAVLTSCVGQQVPRDPPITLPSPALQDYRLSPAFCVDCVVFMQAQQALSFTWPLPRPVVCIFCTGLRVNHFS